MKTKEEYIESLTAELKEWSAQIDVLAAKTEETSAEAKLKYHAELDILRIKLIEATEKLKELEASSGEAWLVIKETAELVWHDLRTGVTAVMAKFQ